VVASSNAAGNSGLATFVNDRREFDPGTSFTGKTTLVDQLIRAGATSYSDGYAVIDEH
jgi:hypothetical protein